MTDRRIGGAGFIDWLVRQGAIADGPIRRVVIDAVWNQAIKVYVELLGTEALIRDPLPAELLDELSHTVSMKAAEMVEVTGLGDAVKTYLRVERRDDAAGA